MCQRMLAVWYVLASFTVSAQSFDASSSTGNALNGRVNIAVAVARAKGVTNVSLPAIKKMPTGVNTLVNAAERYSLILAQPISASTIIRSDESIETWYLLRVTEV